MNFLLISTFPTKTKPPSPQRGKGGFCLEGIRSTRFRSVGMTVGGYRSTVGMTVGGYRSTVGMTAGGVHATVGMTVGGYRSAVGKTKKSFRQVFKLALGTKTF